jgi:hypothetical protein
MKNKYTYRTVVDKDGNTIRYRYWIENFRDEDTGRFYPIERKKPIKVNGEPVTWYSNSEIKNMTASERKSIKIPLKKSFRNSTINK